MIINTKLDLGDNFYVIGKRAKNNNKSCSGCGGDGQISLYDKSIYNCPKCGGDGVMSTPTEGPEWEVKIPHWQHENPPDIFCHRVAFMQINGRYQGDGEENKTWVIYDHYRGGGTFIEDVCFPTLAEALAEIDKRNNLDK